MRVKFERLTERALHERWRGKKLQRLLGLFFYLGEPLPADLQMYVVEELAHARLLRGPSA